MGSQSRKRGWRVWVRDIALIAIVFGGIQWWQQRDLPVGPAPALAGRTLGGDLVALEDYRGKPLLVYFWATWCGICRLQEGHIDGIADDYQVLTVATTSGTPGEIEAYLREKGLDFPVLVDEAGDLGRIWSIRGVPTSFVVDPHGVVRSVSVGYSTAWGLRWRLWRAGLSDQT